MSRTRHLLLLITCIAFSSGSVGCDKLGLGGSSKSEKAKKDKDDDDDDDKKSKKKKKKKDDDDDDDDKDDDDAKRKSKDAPSAASGEAPPPPPPTATATEAPVGESFAGTYRTTYGDLKMRQTGTSLEGRYPTGKLLCTAAGKTLTCDWKDQYGVGKAKLEKQSNGDLKGTWGNGASDTNGGPWNFTLLSAGDPGPFGDEGATGSFAGQYTSTYGVVTMVEANGKVTGSYPGGTLDCTPSGATLDCAWKDQYGTGKATLTRKASGDLSGTWGNGTSNSNGGGWLFRKK